MMVAGGWWRMGADSGLCLYCVVFWLKLFWMHTDGILQWFCFPQLRLALGHFK